MNRIIANHSRKKDCSTSAWFVRGTISDRMSPTSPGYFEAIMVEIICGAKV